MARIPSDHDTIDSYAGTVVSHGARSRAAVAIPQAIGLPEETVVRIVLGGKTGTYFSRPTTATGKMDSRLTGVFETPDAARSPSTGTDALGPWLESQDLTIGRTVHIDVIDTGAKYGLRAPGQREVYETSETANTALAEIARELEEET